MSHARLRITGLADAVATTPDDVAELCAALSDAAPPTGASAQAPAKPRPRLWLTVEPR